MNFHLSILPREHCVIVWARGQCHAGNADWLYRNLLDVLADYSARMVLDLTTLALLDSAGIDVLAAVARRAKVLGGSLEIVDGPCLDLEDPATP